MKKLILLVLLITPARLLPAQEIETWSLSELPARTVLDSLDKTFLEDADEYSYHTTLADILGFVEANLTPSSGGTSLWSRSGDYLYPASITDSIGINTSTPEFQLDVNGTMGIRDVPTSTSDTFLVLTNDSVAKRVAVLGDSTIWGSNGSDKIYTKSATDYVGIGTDNPMTRLHLVDSTGSLGINPYLYTTTAGNYPQLNFGKFNGTPSNYNAIANSTIIGGVNFNASYNTSATASAAGIVVSSTQLWTATERGNQMLFYTVQNDSATRDVSMQIDSNANVMVPFGDVVTFGGYSTWVPTWVWTGGNIGTPTTVVARYMVINRTVFFHVDAEGTNESGSTSTAFNITLPETVKDVNAYIPCTGYYNSSAKAMPTTAFVALIDADVNLKLYGVSISIANNDDFKIVIDGKYEISGK